MFCFVCRQFPSTNKEDLFINKGMRNWKRAGEKLKKHAISAAHSFSLSKWVNYRKPTETVASKISTTHKQLVSENREYFKKLLDIVLYIAKQGLSFRGHDESVDSNKKGNVLQLCELFSKHDQKFKDKYERYHNLTSHDVQNELLHIVREEVIKTIVKEVNECGFFSLMVDEAKSHRVQQLCVCIRYIYDAVLKERVITMEDVSLSRTADSLANIILPFLSRIGITAIMVGQSYDVASVTSGVKNGLQKIICDNNNPYVCSLFSP